MTTDTLPIRQQMLTSYDVTDDINAMNGAAESIRRLADRQSQLVRSEIPGIQEDLQTREAEIVLMAAGEVGDNGKPLYGNAESRKAAVEQTLAHDDAYQCMVTERANFQRELDRLNAEIELHRQQYQMARLAAEAKIAGLRVLGA